MKNAIFGLLAGLALGAASTALNHSGGTDECGGHYNRSTGIYHVHDWTKYSLCGGTDTSSGDYGGTFTRQTSRQTSCYICNNTGYVTCSSCQGTGQTCTRCWSCSGHGHKACRH